MDDLTGGAAEWVDLPIPPARLAALAASDEAELTKFKALEVFGLGRRTDLTHDLEDAGLLGAGKDFVHGFAGYGQLFRCQPTLPHAIGVQNVIRPITVTDVETNGEGIEEPAEDEEGIRLRRCLKYVGERMQRGLRVLHLANNPFVCFHLAPDGAGPARFGATIPEQGPGRSTQRITGPDRWGLDPLHSNEG